MITNLKLLRLFQNSDPLFWVIYKLYNRVYAFVLVRPFFLAELRDSEGQEKAVALGIESLPESLYQFATLLYSGVVSLPEDVKALTAA